MDITTVIFLVIILSVSIGLHEYAHAAVSHYLGDPTPKLQKRLSPNPIKHIDPIGFLMIFLIWFGRGKPVQINPSYYKKPLQWELLVALAWPATNIVLAVLAILIMVIYVTISGWPAILLANWTSDLMITFRQLFAFINIALAVFNMLPIPPLDGFRLVKVVAPRFAYAIEKYNMYIMIAFLFIILWPGRWMVGNFISWTSQAIFDIILAILTTIIY